MVGSFGKSALAAAVIAVLTVNMVYVINISLLQALPVLIRQYRQQMRSIDEIGSLIKQSYWIALICAFISSLILLRMDKLLLLIGQDPDLVALTKDYFHYSTFAIYPALMLSVFSQINIGFERLRTVLIIEFIAAVLRIVWSYGFILGGYGFTQAVTILTREALYSTLNQQQLIVQYLKTALGAALTCNIPIALLFLLCPQLLLSLFITSKSTDLLFLSYCEAFFGFNALIILLDGARSVLTGVLRGLMIQPIQC
jgi:Na+-driven multidrug efflux pump